MKATVKGLRAKEKYFPDIKKPRVFWAGISKGFEDIVSLNRLINEKLNLFEKRFHPHATIARLKYVHGDLQKFLDQNSAVFGTFNVVIKPILKILMLPAQFLTLGLAGFAVNGILLWTVVETVKFLEFNHTQIQIDNLFMYLVIGFILSIAHSIIHWVR